MDERKWRGAENGPVQTGDSAIVANTPRCRASLSLYEEITKLNDVRRPSRRSRAHLAYQYACCCNGGSEDHFEIQPDVIQLLRVIATCDTLFFRWTSKVKTSAPSWAKPLDWRMPLRFDTCSGDKCSWNEMQKDVAGNLMSFT